MENIHTDPILIGLSQSAAEERLQTEGYNEIPEKKLHPILKFLQFYWGPIPWLIEAALILSASLSDWEDFFIIFFLLIVNSLIGFFQEFQADSVIEALKSKLRITVKVLRDGKWQMLPARELVRDDVIHLGIGDIVPADARILRGGQAKVDQSALTGESFPVSRKENEELYAGSILVQGSINARITKTGKKTYYGKAIELVSLAKNVSHLQRALLRIGHFLIAGAIALILVIMIFSYFHGDNLLTTLKFALVLLIASIPVALATILSINLAIGAKILAKKKAIVCHLSAIEELAGVDIFYVDKTGTLTQNKISVSSVFPFGHRTEEEVLFLAALASQLESKDPIDTAVIASVKNKSLLNAYKIIRFFPFDPTIKRSEAELKNPENQPLKVAKGSIPSIIHLSQNAPQLQSEIQNLSIQLAKNGLRSLAVARTNSHKEWELVGVIALQDPPRPESKKLVEEIKKLGIQIKMLTGDHLSIAKQMGKQLDIGNNFEPAYSYFKSNAIKDIQNLDGLAEVLPEHKFRVITKSQDQGFIVGMTGDGVNDTPALKQANVGIAVAHSVDAARKSADIILLSPGLSPIVDAIKESRKIFLKMKTYAFYRMAETIRIILFITLSIILMNFYPLTPRMIVLIALLNDGAIISLAYDRVQYSNHPEKWNLKYLLKYAIIFGIVGVLGSFSLLYLCKFLFKLPDEMTRTIIYLKLSVAGHFIVFSCRTKKAFFKSRPAGVLLIAIIGTQVIASFIAKIGLFMTPIGWSWILFIWLYSLVWLGIVDFIKLLVYKLDAKRSEN